MSNATSEKAYGFRLAIQQAGNKTEQEMEHIRNMRMHMR